LLQVDEMKIIEHMEKITTAWRPEGEWIAKLDLVEQGDRLVVREMDQVSCSQLGQRVAPQTSGALPAVPPLGSQLSAWPQLQVGRCGVECKTVEKAAERIMGEHDTDIAEVLYSVGPRRPDTPQLLLRCAAVPMRLLKFMGMLTRGACADWARLPTSACIPCCCQGKKTRAQFNNWLCYELTGVCKHKPPPLPKVLELSRCVTHCGAWAQSWPPVAAMFRLA
jgi:hypothetical protein